MSRAILQMKKHAWRQNQATAKNRTSQLTRPFNLRMDIRTRKADGSRMLWSRNTKLKAKWCSYFKVGRIHNHLRVNPIDKPGHLSLIPRLWVNRVLYMYRTRLITYNSNSLVCPVSRGKCIDVLWRTKNKKGCSDRHQSAQVFQASFFQFSGRSSRTFAPAAHISELPISANSAFSFSR